MTKSEIGAIRIFDRDTRFQIAAEFADKFEEAARTMKPNEGRIARVDASAQDDTAPTHAAPGRKVGEGKAATSSGLQADSRPKAPWRDRAKGKAGGHPHGKSDKPKHHRKGPRPHAASSQSNDAPKPASKYAHKKKQRAAPQT